MVAKRWRIGLGLTAVMMVAYFAFILLVAFDKETAGELVLGGRVSIGIVLGALLIVLAPILTGLYVRWANTKFDPEVERNR